MQLGVFTNWAIVMTQWKENNTIKLQRKYSKNKVIIIFLLNTKWVTVNCFINSGLKILKGVEKSQAEMKKL